MLLSTSSVQYTYTVRRQIVCRFQILPIAYSYIRATSITIQYYELKWMGDSYHNWTSSHLICTVRVQYSIAVSGSVCLIVEWFPQCGSNPPESALPEAIRLAPGGYYRPTTSTGALCCSNFAVRTRRVLRSSTGSPVNRMGSGTSSAIFTVILHSLCLFRLTITLYSRVSYAVDNNSDSSFFYFHNTETCGRGSAVFTYDGSVSLMRLRMYVCECSHSAAEAAEIRVLGAQVTAVTWRATQSTCASTPTFLLQWEGAAEGRQRRDVRRRRTAHPRHREHSFVRHDKAHICSGPK